MSWWSWWSLVVPGRSQDLAPKCPFCGSPGGPGRSTKDLPDRGLPQNFWWASPSEVTHKQASAKREAVELLGGAV